MNNRLNILALPLKTCIEYTGISTGESATFSQKKQLFIKRKFGLYKNIAVENKRIKNQLGLLINFLKVQKQIDKSDIPKRSKIIFSKRLNTLFFRAGRRMLISTYCIKKYLIQKFISKRFSHFIKHDWLQKITKDNFTLVLIQTGLFYTNKDANTFISNFGILYNNKIVYSPTEMLNVFHPFLLCWDKSILDFFFNKRKTIVRNIKNIKFYKFRSKLFITRFKSLWIPSTEWVQEHSFLYIFRSSNIEFDLRTFIGVKLYNYNDIKFNNFINTLNLSLYMSRSYNWKYIT